VHAAKADADVEIGYWRDGQEQSTTAKLTIKFSESSRQRAWLGVMLQTTNGGKVMVANVMPAGPADQSGIRVGDKIVRIDAEEIDSVDELVQLLGRIKAGKDIEVTVLRDGQEQTFVVHVGSAWRKTTHWLDQHLPHEMFDREWREFLPSETDVDEYRDSFHHMFDQLRNEMRELQDEVNALRGHKSDANDSDEERSSESTNDQPISSDTNTTSAVLRNLYSPDDLAAEDTESFGINVLPIQNRLDTQFVQSTGERVRAYRDYYGGHPQVRYRYAYPRRNYYRYTPRYRPHVYSYGVPYYYYSYPAAPYFYYSGPRVGIYVGPGVYWY
jgi:hypothetical protein